MNMNMTVGPDIASDIHYAEVDGDGQWNDE